MAGQRYLIYSSFSFQNFHKLTLNICREFSIKLSITKGSQNWDKQANAKRNT